MGEVFACTLNLTFEMLVCPLLVDGVHHDSPPVSSQSEALYLPLLEKSSTVTEDSPPAASKVKSSVEREMNATLLSSVSLSVHPQTSIADKANKNSFLT